MKKLLLVLFLCIGILPVFSAEWQQIGEKGYVDIANIAPYRNLYERNHLYSIWNKQLNDGSFSNKDIWYYLVLYICDCDKKEISIKMFTSYDKNKHPMSSHSYDDILLVWEPFIPGSIGDAIWYHACYNAPKTKPNTANFKIKYRK